MTASKFPRESGLVEIAGKQQVRTGHKPGVILALLLAYFVLLQCLVPLHTAIQIGADEGFELAKATLCLKDYKLYTEVWNDQPPLHTFLITQVLKHVSPDIVGPRVVTSP